MVRIEIFFRRVAKKGSEGYVWYIVTSTEKNKRQKSILRDIELKLSRVKNSWQISTYSILLLSFSRFRLLSFPFRFGYWFILGRALRARKKSSKTINFIGGLASTLCLTHFVMKFIFEISLCSRDDFFEISVSAHASTYFSIIYKKFLFLQYSQHSNQETFSQKI